MREERKTRANIKDGWKKRDEPGGIDYISLDFIHICGGIYEGFTLSAHIHANGNLCCIHPGGGGGL